MFIDGEQRTAEKGILSKSGGGWQKVRRIEGSGFIGRGTKCPDEVSSPKDWKL